MKLCHSCKKQIILENVGRQEQCPFCRADLHVCLNCIFYERGAYNDCHEPQAERVLDKSRSNFCDLFNFRITKENSVAPASNPQSKLEALFKNKGS
jgi:hypothetical protein